MFTTRPVASPQVQCYETDAKDHEEIGQRARAEAPEFRFDSRTLPLLRHTTAARRRRSQEARCRSSHDGEADEVDDYV
jgi:hypothetical protein